MLSFNVPFYIYHTSLGKDVLYYLNVNMIIGGGDVLPIGQSTDAF